ARIVILRERELVAATAIEAVTTSASSVMGRGLSKQRAWSPSPTLPDGLIAGAASRPIRGGPSGKNAPLPIEEAPTPCGCDRESPLPHFRAAPERRVRSERYGQPTLCRSPGLCTQLTERGLGGQPGPANSGVGAAARGFLAGAPRRLPGAGTG